MRNGEKASVQLSPVFKARASPGVYASTSIESTKEGTHGTINIFELIRPNSFPDALDLGRRERDEVGIRVEERKGFLVWCGHEGVRAEAEARGGCRGGLQGGRAGGETAVPDQDAGAWEVAWRVRVGPVGKKAQDERRR